MASKIRIKRSTGSSISGLTLANAELAFTEGTDTSSGGRTLYIGTGTSGDNAANIIKIGGAGAFMALEGAQTAAGNKTFSDNVTVTGDLTVNGTTTTISSSTVNVEDKNLELGKVTTPTDSTADGGGITLKGATDKTFNWVNSTDSWTSSEHIALASGKSFSGNLTGNVTGSATSLADGRTIGMTGDVVWTSASFDGSGNVTGTSTIQSGAVEKSMTNFVSDSSTAGLTIKGDGSSVDGYLQLNCWNNNHGIKLKSPPHSAQQTYTLTFPSSVGTANQVLSTSGSGNLTWASLTAGSGIGISGTTISVADDSVTEAMLDIHNAPTEGYILKYTSNGLEWGAAGAGGENNQNAFSNVAVSGQTTVAADSATDTVTFAAGSNVTITTNATSDTVTIAATDTNTQLSTEQVQDIVGAMVSSNTETNISVTYDDTNGKLDFASTNTNTQLSSEQVQDIVGAMLTGNTESGITVAYQDGDGTIDFTVASQTANDFTNALKSKLEGIEASATADQTDAEIKTAYENNSNTNAFTDALLSKLNGIAASATNVTNNNQLTNGAGYITSSGSCASATSASTAGLATNVTVSANNSTNETVYLTFTDGATGSQGIETDTGLSYNPSSGLLTVGVIDGGSF